MELPDLLSRLPPTSDKLYDWWVQVSNKAREGNADSAEIKVVEVRPQENGVVMGDFDNPLPAVKTRVSAISTAQEEDPKLKLVRDWVRKGKKNRKMI